MMRRFGTAACRRTPAFSVAPSSNNSLVLTSGSVRAYTGPISIFGSLISCLACVLAGQAWANNIPNVLKYGTWYTHQMPDHYTYPDNYLVWRFVGGTIGFFFWYFVVAEKKWEVTDMHKWAKRFGPF